jgi:hypothetical protein
MAHLTASWAGLGQAVELRMPYIYCVQTLRLALLGEEAPVRWWGASCIQSVRQHTHEGMVEDSRTTTGSVDLLLGVCRCGLRRV